MVTFNAQGRLGNFLFQAAVAMAYAWRHGLKSSVPARPLPPGNYPVYLPHLVHPGYHPHVDTVTVKERGFPHQEIPFKEEWRDGNIILEGYWQTEKYFKEYRERILKAFGFEWESRPGTVSVHVRRGDYLRLVKKHPPVSKEWIETAMAEFPGAAFIFFSDDIAWCRHHFGHRKDVEFMGREMGSSHPVEVRDLVTMSHCENHICSASTFSWWSVWLNQNEDKRIIMPKLWFVEGWNGIDVRDIVPPEWERM
jgi:hypothetical protein